MATLDDVIDGWHQSDIEDTVGALDYQVDELERVLGTPFGDDDTRREHQDSAVADLCASIQTLRNLLGRAS